MRYFGLLSFALVSVSAVLLAQPTGKTSSPLVTTTPVGIPGEEVRGLVTISTGCSGTLIAHNFVLTAAHCVEDEGTGAQISPAAVAISATWAGGQSRNVAFIQRYRDDGVDIAVLELERPISKDRKLHGAGFPQLVSADSVEVGDLVRIYGRGIFQFAYRAGGVDNSSRSDGQYRWGNRTLKSYSGLAVTTARSGQPIAGGDSGGPLFVLRKNGSEDGIFAVLSRCDAVYLPDKPETWLWATDTTDCVAPRVDVVRNKIVGLIAADIFLYHPPQATIEVAQSWTRWKNPQLDAENGLPYRLDVCLTWATNCAGGQPAADEFCRRKNVHKPLASRIVIKRNVGATTVIGDGRRCKGPGCVGITSLQCNAPISDLDKKGVTLPPA